MIRRVYSGEESMSSIRVFYRLAPEAMAHTYVPIRGKHILAIFHIIRIPVEVRTSRARSPNSEEA
jgi:hypothetical protein